MPADDVDGYLVSNTQHVDCQADQSAGNQHLDHPSFEAEQGNRCRYRDHSGRPIKRPIEAFWPKHVIAEEHCEVEDHAHYCSRDPRQRCGELHLVVSRFHQRATGEDEQERRQEGEPGDELAATAPARNGCSAPNIGCTYPPTKPTKATTMISGPGVVSPKARPSIIWVASAIRSADSALIDIGQHSIRTAKSHQCGLGEEPAHLRQGAVPAKR